MIISCCPFVIVKLVLDLIIDEQSRKYFTFLVTMSWWTKASGKELDMVCFYSFGHKTHLPPHCHQNFTLTVWWAGEQGETERVVVSRSAGDEDRSCSAKEPTWGRLVDFQWWVLDMGSPFIGSDLSIGVGGESACPDCLGHFFSCSNRYFLDLGGSQLLLGWF